MSTELPTYDFQVTFQYADGSPVPQGRFAELRSLVTQAGPPRTTDGNGFVDLPLRGQHDELCVFHLDGMGVINSTMPAPEGPGYLRLPAQEGVHKITLTVVPFA